MFFLRILLDVEIVAIDLPQPEVQGLQDGSVACLGQGKGEALGQDSQIDIRPVAVQPCYLPN